MRGGCDWLHICLPNRRLAGSSPVPRSRSLRYSIMAVQRILVPLVEVRAFVPQQKNFKKSFELEDFLLSLAY